MSRLRGYAALLALVLCACSSAPTERFYTLSSSAGAAPAASGRPYLVAVGPVTVPAMVDRPQIVLSVATNRVSLQEQSRWAEPLKESIPRVVAGNLAMLLAGAQVATESQNAIAAADCRVVLDIQRFDSVLGD